MRAMQRASSRSNLIISSTRTKKLVYSFKTLMAPQQRKHHYLLQMYDYFFTDVRETKYICCFIQISQMHNYLGYKVVRLYGSKVYHSGYFLTRLHK